MNWDVLGKISAIKVPVVERLQQTGFVTELVPIRGAARLLSEGASRTYCSKGSLHVKCDLDVPSWKHHSRKSSLCHSYSVRSAEKICALEKLMPFCSLQDRASAASERYHDDTVCPICTI